MSRAISSSDLRVLPEKHCIIRSIRSILGWSIRFSSRVCVLKVNKILLLKQYLSIMTEVVIILLSLQ